MNETQHSRPLWIGFLASVLFAPTLFAGLVAMSEYNIMIPPILVFLVGILISGSATLLGAVPLVLLLRKRGKLNAVYVCALGGLVGAIAYGVYSFNDSYYPQMNDKSLALWSAQQAALRALLPGCFLGLLSAIALCIGAGITIRPSGRRSGAA